MAKRRRNSSKKTNITRETAVDTVKTAEETVVAEEVTEEPEPEVVPEPEPETVPEPAVEAVAEP
ncbi:MAG: hypothetical protein K6A90_15225, partial [Lachnospiraceae bacterium]|nr:hypothetical protein [Lachnospiraceae bacterium]